MIETSPFSEEEQQVAQLVRSTLQVATKPDHGRLARLRPPVPKRPWLGWGRWRVQQTAVCVLALLCLSLLTVYQSRQPAAGFMPTFTAVTATFTSEPTATVTSTAVAAQPQWATPVPPTPMAALPSMVFIRNP